MGRLKETDKSIAKKRVKNLIEKADEIFSKSPQLAHRYVTLARKLAMKTRIKIEPELQRKFCKHCYKYLRPGTNARKRIKDGIIIYTCFHCKKYTRIPIK